MLKRSGFKPEMFISAIACTIGRSERHACIDAEDLTYEALEDKDAIYLAGGYWRALPIWDNTNTLEGVRLVNPDRTRAEVAIVEQAIAILCHFTYEP